MRVFLRLTLFLGLILASLPTMATHIVGGELTLTYVSGDRYRLRMTLYFDAINGNPGALDNLAQIRFFRKRDGLYMRSEILSLTSQTPVNYTNPECALTPDGVKTDQIVYDKIITLPVDDFSDEQGYYVIWDRCCRNNTIANILDPGGTGQLFYLEFPGRRYQGQPLINSSPTLFRPLSDFACRDRSFSFNFGGSDVDGDSLAYSMVQPLAGNSSATVVGQYPGDTLEISPRPYPPVNWETGFSNIVQITGNPPLNIDPVRGILTMKPNRLGLFVFAIECREYRRGRQIGLVRRDYQILVKDCAPNTPPHVTVQTPNLNNIAAGDTVTLSFENGEACLPIMVADTLPDRVTLALKAPALQRFGTFRDTVGRTASGQPTFGTIYCVNSCAAFSGPVLERVVLHVHDNACSIPAQDSIVFYVRIDSRELSPLLLSSIGRVEFTGNTPRDTVPLPEQATIPLRVGQNRLLLVVEDSLAPIAPPVVYTVQPALPQNATVSIDPIRVGATTRARYDVNIKMPCTADTTPVYTFRFIAKGSYCGFNRADTLTVFARLQRRPILPHIEVFDTVGNPITDGQTIDIRRGGNLSVILRGRSDFDSAAVSLAYGASAPIAARFTPSQGPSPHSAPWSWTPTCEEIIAINGEVRIAYRASILDCRTTRTDSLTLHVNLADTVGGPAIFNNIITQNGDSLNARLDWMPPGPLENCTDKFESLEIYNRWGKRVFQTHDFQFQWPPSSVTPGMYFVVYRFGRQKHRHWVEVVK